MQLLNTQISHPSDYAWTRQVSTDEHRSSLCYLRDLLFNKTRRVLNTKNTKAAKLEPFADQHDAYTVDIPPVMKGLSSSFRSYPFCAKVSGGI